MEKKRGIKSFLLCFFLTGIIFIIPTLFSNLVLAVYDVSSVRPSAALNPTLGIIFGWPAALGTAVANLISDFLSGYGPRVAAMGFLPQILYGILPYYVWKNLMKSTSNKLRLDGPTKTILFALLMLVNSAIIGFFVGLNQAVNFGTPLLRTAFFASLNDFDMCMIFGVPIMAIADHLYSKFRHNGKRKLSINERIIIGFAAIEFVALIIVIVTKMVTMGNAEPIVLWPSIFKTAGLVINILLVLSIVLMVVIGYIRRKNEGLIVTSRVNGNAFLDRLRKLEFTSVPLTTVEYEAYVDENGETSLKQDKVNMHPAYEDDWQISLSCQKGCPMKCSYCDCPSFGFFGNATREDLKYQLETVLQGYGSTHTGHLHIDFKRMGEPVMNADVLEFLEHDMKPLIDQYVEAEKLSVSISTICPRSCSDLGSFLSTYCRIGRDIYGGNASLEISLQSTDDNQRKEIFGDMSLPLSEIAEIAADLPDNLGSKYVLSFVVNPDFTVSAETVASLFDKNKFKIVLVPMNHTYNAVDNGLTLVNTEEEETLFKSIERDFLDAGYEVFVWPEISSNDFEVVQKGQAMLPNAHEKISHRFNKKKNVGLIVAIEMDAIFAYYEHYVELPAPAGYHLYKVSKDNYNLFVLQTGMGEVKASAGVQYLISACNVSTIVNFGVVGGLTEEMGLHRICLVDRVVHYKYDCSEFMPLTVGQLDDHLTINLVPDESLVKTAQQVMDGLMTVTCCSGDKFVGTEEEKTYLHETFGGDICDMESAGIVIACEMNSVPCLLLKAVSDGLAGGANDFYSELAKASRECLEATDELLEKII